MKSTLHIHWKQVEELMVFVEHLEVFQTKSAATHGRRFAVNLMTLRLCVCKQITTLHPDMSDQIYRSWPVHPRRAAVQCSDTLWPASQMRSAISLTRNAVFRRSFPTKRKTLMPWYRLTARPTTGTSTAHCQWYRPCHKQILRNPARWQHKHSRTHTA